jgi:hypothetical protein
MELTKILFNNVIILYDAILIVKYGFIMLKFNVKIISVFSKKKNKAI